MDNLAILFNITVMDNLNHKTLEDGFEGEQFIVLSETDLLRCSTHPVTSQLYPLTFGYFPSAPSHRVYRKEGKRGWSLTYCLHGKGVLELEGKTFVISEGCAFVIPPFTEHTYEADHKQPWSTFWVRFEGRLAEHYVDLIGATLGKPVTHMPKAKNLFRTYQQLYAARKKYYGDIDLIELSNILGLLLTEARRAIIPLSSKQLSCVEQIQKSISFMEKNIHRSCNLQDFISAASMSPRHYSRQFHVYTGVSPMNYFLQMKINDASHKLQHTELSIEQIAKSLGYTDPLYFSRTFRKAQDISPSQYRKEQKNFTRSGE